MISKGTSPENDDCAGCRQHCLKRQLCNFRGSWTQDLGLSLLKAAALTVGFFGGGGGVI